MSRSRHRLVVLVSFLLSLPLHAETLSELFQRAKEQVKAQSWQDALVTLDQLDAESARAGNENVREQLTAPIAFYRGVCEANLDQTEKAEADFATFRRAQPDSAIDPTAYSKKAVAAFEAAGKPVAPAAAGKDAASHDSRLLLRRFEEFQAPPNTDEKPDERWADGPVKWLLTPEETASWSALTSEEDRSAFVEKFWARRDPTPETPDNPSHDAFDRRVAFADSYFRLDEQLRGSLTDPGMVFVLLGPPTRTGRKPILGDEENNISDGSSVPGYWHMEGHNSVHVDGWTNTDASSGFREIWYYRRDTLPKAVSASEVNATFVTKVGYGRFVLQRQPAIDSALAAARAGQP
jgi:GWxTD domain-containing protein